MAETKPKLHFMGVGGVGMSALAKFAVSRGATVTGSDIAENRRTLELEDLGVGIIFDQSSVIAPLPDEVVISSAISEDNPELKAYREKGIPIVHRSELLARYVNAYRGLAVAGTHGKTTTSSMLYHILSQAHLEPSAFLGGELIRERTNCLVGSSDLLVVEADESDGTFVRTRPEISVVTSIDPDVNVTAEAYEDCGYSEAKAMDVVEVLFDQFVANTRGRVVACYDHPNVRKRLDGWPADTFTYGLSAEAELTAKNLSFHDYQVTAEVSYRGEYAGIVHVPLPGQHNLLNALGAVAVAMEVGVPLSNALQHVRSFFGVRRRFEIVGRTKGKIYVDDYAHNPQKIAAALRGAKMGNVERIIAVFQPHRYTRTKLLQEKYPKSFSDADLVLVTDIFAAGEEPLPGVDSKLLTREINKVRPAIHTPHLKDVTLALQDTTRAGDIVVGLGAGSVGEWIRRISRWDKAGKRWPSPEEPAP
jgi:UDP-N-acetylmuramate--alanine ligase